MIGLVEHEKHRRLEVAHIYRLISLQFQRCQIVSWPGISEFQIENVTEQLGVIPAHLLLLEEVYRLGISSPSYLLLPTVADDFRMPDDSAPPSFQSAGACDALIQLRLDVRVC